MGSAHLKPKEPKRIAMLSGGVGGARLARGLAAVVDDLTVIINVADDDEIYGLHVAADIDTVTYTLAGIEGPHGWGIAKDTFRVMDALSDQGIDTTFRLGDRDLANCLARTIALDKGSTLSEITDATAKRLGISARLLPVTDDPVRTRLRTSNDEWLAFQEYFVIRRHRDVVRELRFDGAANASPAPDVLQVIADADTVVIGPSNPVLSIWPMLAIEGVRDAVAAKPVAAVSPLIGGDAVKGPAAQILSSLGYPAGTAGVVAAYDGLIDVLYVDHSDAADGVDGVELRPADIHIATAEAAQRLASQL